MTNRANVTKIALLFSCGALAIFAVLVFTEKLTLLEGAICSLAAFAYCFLAARPCMADLSALRRYVNDLSEDKEVECPPLTVLSAVETLPDAVEKLRESRQRHAKKLESTLQKNYVIFHSLPAPVLVLSPERIVLDGNRSARALFRSELLGRKLDSLISDPRLHKACVQLKGRDEHISHMEVALDDGTKRHFECILHPISAKEMGLRQGERLSMSYAREAVICLFYDVSNIVKTQEAMRDFVSNASHEIQTPLTGIIGFLETVLDEDFAKDNGNAAKFLRICLERSYALSSLARDLLSLAKIEISAHDVFNDRVNVAALATSAANVYRNDALLISKGMTLISHVAENVPDFYGNSTELQLMFSNLLSNAVKYGATGGKIEVTVALYADADPEIREIVLSSDRSAELHYAENYVTFAVRNDGQVIPEEKIPRLTERFYRADSSRGEGAGGSGIGLSIVKSIVEHHNGLLRIESSEEKGNLFEVFFPVIDVPSHGANGEKT
ncbi:MAG: ATP-binding protein [Rickettsiales bacterium]